MKSRKPLPPLTEQRLQELALAYVGRFATTRAKLRVYLSRKLRERGWADGPQPDLQAIAERFAEQGFIDDAGFALAKAQGLSARGYGRRRVLQALQVAGIAEEDREPALAESDAGAAQAALRFAERKRLGPFGRERPDHRARERAIGAFVRAGHSFELAKAIMALVPGTVVDPAALSDHC